MNNSTTIKAERLSPSDKSWNCRNFSYGIIRSERQKEWKLSGRLCSLLVTNFKGSLFPSLPSFSFFRFNYLILSPEEISIFHFQKRKYENKFFFFANWKYGRYCLCALLRVRIWVWIFHVVSQQTNLCVHTRYFKARA